MPLLFLLAGISTKYSLQKRTGKEYLVERLKRLLVPFLFGTIVFMPIMSYIGDKFNNSYNEGFLKHYAVFVTKYTDLTGADGEFSVGQFWFLLYLLIISIVSVGIIALSQKVIPESEKTIPFWLVLFQYILYGIIGNKTCVLFIGTNVRSPHIVLSPCPVVQSFFYPAAGCGLLSIHLLLYRKRRSFVTS